MVYAIFTAKEYILNDKNVDDVKRAFRTGKMDFLRWGLTSDIVNDVPEIGDEKIASIVRFAVINDRVTLAATDEEIRHMFIIYLNENRHTEQVYTSNQYNQQLINIDFSPAI